MKNSIFILIIAITLGACKKKEELPDNVSHYSGEAFILKSPSIDTAKLTRETILDSNAAFIAYHFKFQIELELYFIKNLDLIHPTNAPKTNFFSSEKEPIILDSNLLSQTPIDKIYTGNESPYAQLMIFNTELDKDMMFYASTGFFLEQYINQYNGSDLQFGFNSTQDELVIANKDLMTIFYEKTRNINTSSSISPEFKYQEQQPSKIIKSIQNGIIELKKSNATNKQLTLVNYTLVNPSTIDTSELAELQNLLNANPTISLNIISLFPLNFLQHHAIKTGGFFENDITYINDFSAFLNSPDDLKKIIERKSFPSSYVIQNLNKLIAGASNQFQKYAVNCILIDHDSLIVNTGSAHEKILNEQYHIGWLPNEYMTTPHLYFKPILK